MSFQTHILHLAMAAALVVPPAPAVRAAEIEGRVVLPPPRPTPVVNRRYDVVTMGGVASMNPPRAVVYLEGRFPAAAAPATARIEQKDQMFVPALLPIRVGTKVEFPNGDSFYHSVFSFSPAMRFDLGRYRSDEVPVPSRTFNTPGLVTLRCDIHEHMRALILVLDTPHFTVTDTEGRYRLPNLPAGSYVLKVWIDSRTTLERPVTLAADGVLRADFP